MAIQVQDAYDQFDRYKKDISDISNSLFFDWMNQINRFAYRKLRGSDPERFISETNFTVSSDPQTSALPSDFRDITESPCGFYEVDDDSKDTVHRLRRTGHGRKDAGYYIEGTNVIFTGMNDSTVYKLRYIPALTEIDSLDDYLTVDSLTGGAEVIPEEYIDYVIKAVDVLYSQWDESIPDEAIGDQRFVRVMDELLSHIRKEPNTYQLDDHTLAY